MSDSRRASKILVAIIVLNVLLGGFAAVVILSPEWYALDQAIKKARSLPPPPQVVMNAVLEAERPFLGSLRGAASVAFRGERKEWLMRPDCGRICRIRYAAVLWARHLFETRDTMLRAFIATVPMGEVVGLQAAAPHYFNEDLATMELPQGAALVAMIRSPSTFSPREFPERLLKRRNLFLKRMLDGNSISRANYDAAAAAPLFRSLSP